MSFNAIFQGAPANVPAPGSQGYAEGMDVVNGAEYFAGANGWTPVSGAVARNVQLGLSGEATNFVYTAPVTGLYLVSAYEISTDATSGTLPTVTATFDDADTTGSTSTTVLADKTSVAAANVVNEGSGIVNVAAGGTITVSTSNYASLSYNLKLRIQYLG
jgi:hypothetical protein